MHFNIYLDKETAERLNAATALAQNLIMVTSNTREFERISGLQLYFDQVIYSEQTQ